MIAKHQWDLLVLWRTSNVINYHKRCIIDNNSCTLCMWVRTLVASHQHQSIARSVYSCIHATAYLPYVNICVRMFAGSHRNTLASKHSPLWMQLHVCKCIPAIVCQNRHFLSTFLVSGRIIKILGTMDEPSSNNHTSLGLFNLVRYSSSSSHLNCPSITF